MTTTTEPTTKPTGVIEALDENATAAINVGRRLQELRDEITRIGARGRAPSPGADGRPPTPGRPATGEIHALLSRIVDAHAAGAREGKRGDVSKLEAQIGELQQRVDGLLLEHHGVRREGDRVRNERMEILRAGRVELDAHARQVASDGVELIKTLAAAARDVEIHRGKVSEAVSLAISGLADADERRAAATTYAPWVIRRPAEGRTPTSDPLPVYWESVSRVSNVPQ
jgi:hypothetical protein